MKILIIHGQSHKGSTYNVAHMLAEKLGGEIEDIFLSRDLNKFCLGCGNCFTDENLCPHREEVESIINKMDKVDIIILASPVYVLHLTGSMKNFLDHLAYRFMVHRPSEKMFKKIGICISTAAGAGMKNTNNEMADSLLFWGVPKIYKYGVAVAEVSYENVKAEIKEKIDKDTTKLAKKILKEKDNLKPGIKTKFLFNIMRMMQKKGWNPSDCKYWEKKGWNKDKRPWE